MERLEKSLSVDVHLEMKMNKIKVKIEDKADKEGTRFERQLQSVRTENPDPDMVFILLKPENSTLVPLWDVKIIPHCASASISTAHNLISSNASRERERWSERERERGGSRETGREGDARGGGGVNELLPLPPVSISSDVRTHLQITERRRAREMPSPALCLSS